MKQSRTYPIATITKKATRALKDGFSWVYADEVIKIETRDKAARAVENASLVDVCEENGTYRGTAFLSQNSTIRLRMVSTNANDRFDEAFWKRRIMWAWQHRVSCMKEQSLPHTDDTHCCRVIFSEADGIPGLIVDRYESVLVCQITTVGVERIKDLLYRLVVEVLHEAGEDIRALYERCDSPVRTKEGLALYKGWYTKLAPALSVPTSSQLIMHENGIAFSVDVENSQKTGFFLDQKYNRRAIRSICAGKRVLDCFSHVGPFALNAAVAGAKTVRAVDISELALKLAQENARLNHVEHIVHCSCADVLDYLRKLAQDKNYAHAEGGPFDVIILDPPAFTKSRSTISSAMRGYKEINYHAMKLLPRGGYLATCSCSHFMSTKLLQDVLRSAAQQAQVTLKQIEARQQACDHPIIWGMPETHYLDFFIFQII
ncbi:class I SAM-dependent rRNA methyltransferase [Fannyhessea vaginae]|uniref:class I SAM-dependent rRNA methyltransferase n=1 Tax=Fannyhessea vaginae TaxID=82135 RepID=UPI0026F1AA69|nr:class I SAM-dependent rRNA methyltransferase [Fannyhessea vaginae]